MSGLIEIKEAGDARTPDKPSRSLNPNTKRPYAAKLPEFSRSLPMALLRGREAVMRCFRPSLHQHGVTEQQWRVLRALAQVGATEVTELSRITVLLAPSLSRILRDLARRGLIARKTVKTDLRRSTVWITAGGRRLIREVAPQSEAAYAHIRSQFSEARLNALHKLLSELEVALGEIPAENVTRAQRSKAVTK